MFGSVSATTDTFFHLVERVLGSVQESLIHGPVVVLGKFLDFFGGNGLNVLVELVGANSLDEIINSSFNLVVLASKLLRLNGDPFFLHLYKLVKSVSLSILRQVNQDSLGEGFKVVLDSVFHNIIDVNDELFEFGKTLVHMGQVAINVH